MADRLVLRGGLVFDGTGAEPAVLDVAVADGLIVEVGTDLAGDRTVELAGHGLLPGFVDCHVHVMVSTLDLAATATTAPSYRLLQATRNLRRTLAAGVTTARDADGADAGLRQALADGLVAGPRLQVAIAMLSQTGGRGDHWLPAGFALPAFDVHAGRPDGIADGPDEVRRMARRLIRAGADVLKVAVSGSALGPAGNRSRGQYRADELAEVVAEARAAGLGVMAHSHSAAGAALAVAAGVRSIEHGSELDQATIASMAERGTWLVPTLQASRTVSAEFAEQHRDSVRRAHRAGVRIAMGSDSGVTLHGANLAELAALTEAGLSDLQALAAGTSAGAELLGLAAELGTVEAGKRADLVVVRDGPLPVAGLPDRLVAVLQAGRLVAGRLPQDAP
ncbi:MAG: amidohydrolase family protein [Jatrophihabitantaceae bacterium]